MVEELLEPPGEVLAVAALYKVVGLVVIFKKPARLSETAKVGEIFDALVPWNGPVVVIVHDQEGSLDFVGMEDGGVLDVKVETSFVPEGLPDTALAMFVLSGAGHSGFPSDAAVGRCHVAYRGSGARRREHISTRDKPGGLVASPALSLDGHPALVGEGILLAKCLGTGADAVVGALAGVAVLLDDVRYEHYVTP